MPTQSKLAHVALGASLFAIGCSNDDRSTVVYRVRGLDAQVGDTMVVLLVDPGASGANALSQGDSVLAAGRTTVSADGVGETTMTGDFGDGPHVVEWFVDSDGDGSRTESADGSSAEVGWRDTVDASEDTAVERDVTTAGRSGPAPGTDAGPRLGWPTTCEISGCGPDVPCKPSPTWGNQTCYLYNDAFLCCLLSPYGAL